MRSPKRRVAGGVKAIRRVEGVEEIGGEATKEANGVAMRIAHAHMMRPTIQRQPEGRSGGDEEPLASGRHLKREGDC